MLRVWNPLRDSGIIFFDLFRAAPVAQRIEHWIPNPGVACSSHAGGAMIFQCDSLYSCQTPMPCHTWTIKDQAINV